MAKRKRGHDEPDVEDEPVLADAEPLADEVEPDPVVEEMTGVFKGTAPDPVLTPTPEVEQAPSEPAPDPTVAPDGTPIPDNTGATLVSQDPAPAAVEPPEPVDNPFVYQDGALLTCTNGNWTHVPTSYSYQWQHVGSVVGSDQPNYTVTPELVGYTVNCVVTARNAGGAGVAQSNEVVVVEVPDPQTAAMLPPAT